MAARHSLAIQPKNEAAARKQTRQAANRQGSDQRAADDIAQVMNVEDDARGRDSTSEQKMMQPALPVGG